MHTGITFWLDAMDMRQQCILAKRSVDRRNTIVYKQTSNDLQTLREVLIWLRSLGGSVTLADSSTSSAATTAVTDSPVCDVRTVQRQRTRMYSNLRGALSFDNMDVYEFPESDDAVRRSRWMWRLISDLVGCR
ncbi:hypothetical protein L1987_02317 [Smallanthus sonchifolius]|uniref:Uncharacterized protein n=1 Tax=Smallanthus sonchifolius TaxID=185202 RepID=A0ACB9K7N7_9ASTR|nr:hypothetical protein L1987_02317 [Smallanthus sonchifolius]